MAISAVRVWLPAAVRVFAGHQGPDPRRGRSSQWRHTSVTASADKSIKVFDVKTGNVVRTLAGHAGAVKAVAVTKDGAKILSGSDDKTFRVWNVADGKPLLTAPPLPAGVTAVAAASNNALAAAGLADGTLKVYDLTTADAAKAERASFKSSRLCRDGGRVPARLRRRCSPVRPTRSSRSGRCRRLAAPKNLAGHTAQIYSVVWSPDGKLAATAAADKTARLWDVAKGTRSARSTRMKKSPTLSRFIPRATCSPPAATTS